MLSSNARKTRTVGEIVNLMSVDSQKCMELMTYVNLVWSAPLQILIALVLLWFTMGPSIFAGVGVMVLLIPVNTCVAALIEKLQVGWCGFHEWPRPSQVIVMHLFPRSSRWRTKTLVPSSSMRFLMASRWVFFLDFCFLCHMVHTTALH